MYQSCISMQYATSTFIFMYHHCIYIFNQSRKRIYIEKGGTRSILKLGGMGVTKSIGRGRVVSAKGSGGNIIGIDVIVLEDWSSVLLTAQESGRTIL